MKNLAIVQWSTCNVNDTMNKHSQWRLEITEMSNKIVEWLSVMQDIDSSKNIVFPVITSRNKQGTRTQESVE